MFAGRHSRRRTGRFGLAVLVAAFVPTCAHAAWLGYKNSTPAAVVIRTDDIVIVNGKVQQVRPGTPHVLYPGEVAWDAISAPGPRVITVYDPAQANRAVLQERVDCNAKDDIVLSLQFLIPPPIRGQPQQPPQLKLLPILIPQLPKGQLPPGVRPGTPPPGGPNPGKADPGKAPTNPTPPANPPGGRGKSGQ
jgi:hypothetical protein